LALTISEAKYLAIIGNVASIAARTSSWRNRATNYGSEWSALGVETDVQPKLLTKRCKTCLILAPVPPVYINSLSHNITDFGKVSALTIMTLLTLGTVRHDHAGQTRQ